MDLTLTVDVAGVAHFSSGFCSDQEYKVVSFRHPLTHILVCACVVFACVRAGGQSIGSVNAIVDNTQRKEDSQTWTNDGTIKEIPGLKSSLGALDDEFKSKIDTPKLGVLQAHSKILTKYEQRVAAIAARQKLTNERLSTAKS